MSPTGKFALFFQLTDKIEADMDRMTASLAEVQNLVSQANYSSKEVSAVALLAAAEAIDFRHAAARTVARSFRFRSVPLPCASILGGRYREERDRCVQVSLEDARKHQDFAQLLQFAAQRLRRCRDGTLLTSDVRQFVAQLTARGTDAIRG